MNSNDRNDYSWIEFPGEWANCDMGTCACSWAAQDQCADFRTAFFMDLGEASTIDLESEMPDSFYVDADRERHFDECPSATAAVGMCLCPEIVQAREETWRDFFTSLLGGGNGGLTLPTPPNHDAWCPIEQYGRGSCACDLLKAVRVAQWERLSAWRATGRLGRLSNSEAPSELRQRRQRGAADEAA